MSTNVHPSAVVEKGAELADGVTVGPFAYVGAHVKLGQLTPPARLMIAILGNEKTAVLRPDDGIFTDGKRLDCERPGIVLQGNLPPWHLQPDKIR